MKLTNNYLDLLMQINEISIMKLTILKLGGKSF